MISSILRDDPPPHLYRDTNEMGSKEREEIYIYEGGLNEKKDKLRMTD